LAFTVIATITLGHRPSGAAAQNKPYRRTADISHRIRNIRLSGQNRKHCGCPRVEPAAVPLHIKTLILFIRLTEPRWRKE
jgi:hypothetical protein